MVRVPSAAERSAKEGRTEKGPPGLATRRPSNLPEISFHGKDRRQWAEERVGGEEADTFPIDVAIKGTGEGRENRLVGGVWAQGFLFSASYILIERTR